MNLFQSTVTVVGAMVLVSHVKGAGRECSKIATGNSSIQGQALPFEIQSPTDGALQAQASRNPSSNPYRMLKDLLPSQQRGFLTKAVLETLKRTVVNYENEKNVLLNPATAHPFSKRYQLSLGKRLGLGMQGSVFILEEMQTLSPTGLIQDTVEIPTSSVIKFPHRLKTQSSPIPGAEAAIREEGATYQLLMGFETEKLPRIEQRKDFPSETYWTRGKLPVIPVLGAIAFNEGTVLVKPRVRGWNLKEIYDHYGNQLPDHMKTSLKTLYELLRNLNSEWPELIRRGTRQGVLTGARSTLDINPRNLMWIPQSEVEHLKSAGVPIEREGFFLIEFAFAATRMPQIESWEGFLSDFQNGLELFH